MNLPDRPERRYDDEEVGKLLKRATELQRRDPSTGTGSSTGGLSLRELEEIAAEAGIDPSYLRRAAAEAESQPTDESLGSRLAGESLSIIQETVIPGELTSEGFERVLVVVQRRTAELGQPSFMGRTLTWQAETANKTRLLQVVVTVREGQTHIRAEERLNQLAGALFGGIMGGAGGGLGIAAGTAIGLEVLGSALFALAFPVAMVGLTYIGAREIYRSQVRKRRIALAELVDDIAQEVAGAVVTQPRLGKDAPPSGNVLGMPGALGGGMAASPGAIPGPGDAGEGSGGSTDDPANSDGDGPLGGAEPPRRLP